MEQRPQIHRPKRPMTIPEFRKQASDVIAKLTAEVPPFPDDPEAKAKRLEEAEADFLVCSKIYLPHYFSKPSAAFHHDLGELLDIRPDVDKHQVVTPVGVAAPRGFAKTTITSFGYVIHQMLFKKRHFIIVGSDTKDLAADLTGYILLEFMENERIRQDFGWLLSADPALNDFEANGVRLLARGSGQRVRGLKHKQHRPDLVILDDLENDKNVRNPRLVDAKLKWINEAVYPAIDPGGSLFIIGTILARRSALAQIVHAKEPPYSTWKRRIYKAFQDDGTSLWPDLYPVPILMKQKEMMGSLAFNKEKQNEPVDEEGAFREQWIVAYTPEQIADQTLSRYGWFDPSVGSGESSDYKAIVVVGLNADQLLYVLHAFIRRCSLDTALSHIFNLHREHPFVQFGVEDNVFQKLLLNEIDRMAGQFGFNVPVRGITNTLAKETRVSGLSPLVERGRIRFNLAEGDQALLKEQLIMFPSPTVNDDGPDSLEGACRLAGQVGLGGAPNIW